MTDTGPTPKDLERMKELGVNVIHLPNVHDEASLFDYTFQLLKTLSKAVGTPDPTYEQVQTSVDKVKDEFDF